MEFLFRNRGSGKRQVKPSPDIQFLEEQLAGEDESSDEDFEVAHSRDHSHSGRDEEDSSEDSSEESSDTSDDDAEVKALGHEMSTEELLALAQKVHTEDNSDDNVKVPPIIQSYRLHNVS